MEVTLAPHRGRGGLLGVHHATEFTLPPARDATGLRMGFSAVQSRTNALQQALWTRAGALGAKAAERRWRRTCRRSPRGSSP